MLYLRLIILLVDGDVPAFLVTDFMDLKIKPTQSFKCAHMDRVCVRVFIWMIDRICICIYVFLKKIKLKLYLFLTYFIKRSNKFVKG
jgi:hypothetical protein